MTNHSSFAEFLLNKIVEDATGNKSRRGDHKEESPGDIEERIALLQKACADYQKKYSFTVGDVVTWKDNFKGSRKWPEVGQPAVVVEVYNDPFEIGVNKKTIGTSLLGEILDIKIVVITDDGELCLFAYPSIGFQPWALYQASVREAIDAAKKIVTEAKTE